MTRRILVTAGRIFDAIEARWESTRAQRHIASLLIVVFLLALALTAPRIWDASLRLGATLFAVALTWVYNRADDDLRAADPGTPG